jgi:hypothetical protein
MGLLSSSCPGLSRASTSNGGGSKKDVDGRDKPGHDEKANHFEMVRKSLNVLTLRMTARSDAL